MGAGRGPRAVPPPRRRRRAVATGVPFRCLWTGCSVTMKSVSLQWINQHRANHEYSAKKEREALVKRQAEEAKEINAAGPSRNRKAQQRLDMAANQRKSNGGGGNNTAGGKKHSRGRQN